MCTLVNRLAILDVVLRATTCQSIMLDVMQKIRKAHYSLPFKNMFCIRERVLLGGLSPDQKLAGLLTSEILGIMWIGMLIAE